MQVKYYPSPEDTDICRLSDRLPLNATVACVRLDGRVDLIFTDDIGRLHSRFAIPIFAIGETVPADEPDYCIGVEAEVQSLKTAQTVCA